MCFKVSGGSMKSSRTDSAAVNPQTGSIGHRRLVLDQSMIMAALDDALDNGAIQRDFASDPVSWTAKTYLSAERMSIH